MCIYIHIYVYIYMHTYVYMRTSVYVLWLCLCLYIYTNIYVKMKVRESPLISNEQRPEFTLKPASALLIANLLGNDKWAADHMLEA